MNFKYFFLLVIVVFSSSAHSRSEICDLWEGPQWFNPILGRNYQNISGMSFSKTNRRIYFTTAKSKRNYVNFRKSIEGEIERRELSEIRGHKLGDTSRGACPDGAGNCLYILSEKSTKKGRSFHLSVFKDRIKWENQPQSDYSASFDLRGDNERVRAFAVEENGSQIYFLSHIDDAWLFKNSTPLLVYKQKIKTLFIKRKKRLQLSPHARWKISSKIKSDGPKSYQVNNLDIRDGLWAFLTSSHVLVGRPSKNFKKLNHLKKIETANLRDRRGISFLDNGSQILLSSRGGPSTRPLQKYECVLDQVTAPKGSISLWDYTRVLGRGNRDKGYKKLDPLMDGLHKAFTKEKLTDDTADLLHTLRTTGLEMDLQRLHGLLPFPGKGKEKHVAVWGVVKPNFYSYSLHPYYKRPEKAADFVLYAGLEPKEDNFYEAKAKGRLFLADSDSEKWASAMNFYFQWYCQQTTVTEKFIDRLKKDLPHTFKFAEQWGKLSFYKDKEGRVNGSYQLDVKAFRKPHPLIYRYLKRIDNLLDMKVVGKIKENEIFSINVDSGNGLFEWKTNCNSSGWQSGKETIPFFSKKKQTVNLESEWKLALQGVYPELSDFNFTLDFYQKNNFPKMELRPSNLPEISLGSNPLTFIPVLLARAVIDVKGELKNFFKALLDSKAFAKLEIKEEGPFAEAKIETEGRLLNNFVIRAGFQLMALKLNPNDKTFESMRLFRDVLFDQIYLDYKLYRP